MRLEVSMTIKKKIVFICIMMPCNLVGGYQCYEEIYCSHLQRRNEEGDNMFL
jgi:hypothetical protein